jgi:AcrR family transcriptional regulator
MSSVEMTPLPRGRHGLSREEVEGSQRLRLVRAMAEVMAEKGYARTSVADILRRARVSRETFYELFDSKEDCFMSAFDEAYRGIGEALAAGAGGELAAGGAGGRAVLDIVLEHYLAALASEPDLARVFLIEVYAAGPKAMERRLELQRGLVEVLAQLIGAKSAEDRFAVEAAVAAIVSLVTARLAVGDPEGIRDLHAPLLQLLERLGLG